MKFFKKKENTPINTLPICKFCGVLFGSHTTLLGHITNYCIIAKAVAKAIENGKVTNFDNI